MNTTDFDNILWFALRASAAYETPDFIQKNFPNTSHCHNLADIDIQYFIENIPEKNCQLISIRGTDNLTNIKEDVSYTQSKNKNLSIYVHRGFDKSAYKVYQNILPYLTPKAKVCLTGHSLGAAIATLLMMYLHHDGFIVEHSINFGQPKVTNKQGVAAYNFLPLTRIVNDEDIVPLLPPTTLLDSIHGLYAHLGDEVILLNKCYYHYLDEHSAEQKSVGNFWHNLGHESLKDHLMKNYLKSIRDKQDNAIELPLS